MTSVGDSRSEIFMVVPGGCIAKSIDHVSAWRVVYASLPATGRGQSPLPGINPARAADIQFPFQSAPVADVPDRLRSSASAGAHTPADIARRSVHPTAP